jgi:hypothetical protein
MCIVIDERETKLYDAVVELVRLGTFNVPRPGRQAGSGAGRHLYKTKTTKTCVL